MNVFLGVFGSAILTAMTSLVSYLYEKQNVMKGFFYHTRQLLLYLNKYQDNMSLEQKIRFFLDYSELDKSAWDIDVGNIDFFVYNRKKKNYIYTNIYQPILDFNRAVDKHIVFFRWHLDGTGKNDAIMQEIVTKLQGHLLEKTERDVPIEFDENGQATKFCHCSSTKSKLVNNIQKELKGYYYEIMYGKRIAEKQHKLQEDKDNG